MLEGRCPRCSTQYRGWALGNPRGQTCPKCGVALEITEDGHTYKGYSPFTADKYVIKSPGDAPATTEKGEDSSVEKD
jgi:hypothetical protein